MLKRKANNPCHGLHDKRNVMKKGTQEEGNLSFERVLVFDFRKFDLQNNAEKNTNQALLAYYISVHTCTPLVSPQRTNRYIP